MRFLPDFPPYSHFLVHFLTPLHLPFVYSPPQPQNPLFYFFTVLSPITVPSIAVFILALTPLHPPLPNTPPFPFHTSSPLPITLLPRYSPSLSHSRHFLPFYSPLQTPPLSPQFFPHTPFSSPSHTSLSPPHHSLPNSLPLSRFRPFSPPLLPLLSSPFKPRHSLPHNSPSILILSFSYQCTPSPLFIFPSPTPFYYALPIPFPRSRLPLATTS